MKMKNALRLVFLLAVLIIVPPTLSAAPVIPVTETPDQQVARLQNRLEEIKAMDKHELSRKEKKALRGEVRAIKKEMAAISGGVYLSVGAIILIALLIILLA